MMTARFVANIYRLVTIMLVMVAGCGRSEQVVVGSKTFTESVILGELLCELVRQAPASVRHIRQIGGTQVVWGALKAGEIDVYPEYTGTILQEIYADRDFANDAELKEALAADGVVMSSEIGFNNSYAIAMTKPRAEQLGIRTISDLRNHPDLRVGFGNEFLKRSDGWPSLQLAYSLPQTDVTGLEHTLAYQALVNGGLDLIDAYTTDPQIAQHDLLLLEDDQSHFPLYEAVLLYRADFAEAEPEIVQQILQLTGEISESEMAQMNQQAQIDQESETSIAAQFLKQKFGIQTDFKEASLPQRLLQRTVEHLWLVGVSLFAAIAVAIPLGVVAFRNPRGGQLIVGFAEIVQTIPGLALLVLIAVVFVNFGWPMISPWPVIVALFLYSLLPILRNTIAGLAGISGSLRESAQVLGLSRSAQLWQIELPLAAPLILAGIKTTAVINVGYAALGGLIGAGGYGQPILAGLRLSNTNLMLEGAIPAALLALLVKFLFVVFEPWVISPGLRLSMQK